MGKTYRKNDWNNSKKARKDRNFKKSKKFKELDDSPNKTTTSLPVVPELIEDDIIDVDN